MDPQLSQRMDELSQTTKNYITAQKSALFESREVYNEQISTLQSEKQQVQATLNRLQQQQTELSEALQQELEQQQRAEVRVEGLTQRQKDLAHETTSLKTQVEQVLEQVKNKRQEVNELKQGVNANRERDYPEVLLYEQILGLKIVGVKNDLLRFIFTNINHHDLEKQYVFEIDVSQEEYNVTKTSPEVEKETLANLLEELNKKRDLTWFVSGIRKVFKSMDV